MKKLRLFLSLPLITILLFSCTSIESDAKKVAKLQCEAEKIMQKVLSGDLSVIEESKELASEAEALKKEIEEKYTSDSDKDKFADALLKEMGNCN